MSVIAQLYSAGLMGEGEYGAVPQRTATFVNGLLERVESQFVALVAVDFLKAVKLVNGLVERAEGENVALVAVGSCNAFGGQRKAERQRWVGGLFFVCMVRKLGC